MSEIVRLYVWWLRFGRWCGRWREPVRDHFFEAVYGAFYLGAVRHVVFDAVDEWRDGDTARVGGRIVAAEGGVSRCLVLCEDVGDNTHFPAFATLAMATRRCARRVSMYPDLLSDQAAIKELQRGVSSVEMYSKTIHVDIGVWRVCITFMCPAVPALLALSAPLAYFGG